MLLLSMPAYIVLSLAPRVLICTRDQYSTGSNANIKESDARRAARMGEAEGEWKLWVRRCFGQWESFVMSVFLLLPREFLKGKGGTYIQEKRHVLRSVEG